MSQSVEVTYHPNADCKKARDKLIGSEVEAVSPVNEVTYLPNASCKKAREKIVGPQVESFSPVKRLPYGNISRDLPIRPLNLGGCDEVTFLRNRPGLGDMVSLLGAIEKFKENHPNLKVTLLGENPILSIAENHFSIDRIISSKRRLKSQRSFDRFIQPRPLRGVGGLLSLPRTSKQVTVICGCFGFA